MRFTIGLASFASGLFLTAAVMAQGLERPEALGDTAALIRDQLAETGLYDEVLVTEDLAVEARNAGEIAQVFYPDNLHLLLRRLDDAEERASALSSHVAALTEAAGDDAQLSPATLDRVIPVVRNREYGTDAPGGPLLSEPLAGDLSIFYVLDSPSTVQYISQSHLSEAKISVSALKTAATENLAQLAADMRIEGGIVGLVFLDGYYESSLLLNKRVWHDIARDVPNLVAIAPARDLVAFGDGSNPEVVAFLEAKATEISDSVGGVLSNEVLHWTELGWVVN